MNNPYPSTTQNTQHYTTLLAPKPHKSPTISSPLKFIHYLSVDCKKFSNWNPWLRCDDSFLEICNPKLTMHNTTTIQARNPYLCMNV